MTTAEPKKADPDGGNPDTRFPSGVYRHGVEPDPRFTLANERTFLAWVRTALAMLAGGVALKAITLGVSPTFRLAAATVLIVAGLLTAVHAWFGWARTERALRRGTALPAPLPSLPIVLAVVVAGVLCLLGGLLW